MSQAFISSGFTNWNDAKRCFGKHEQLLCQLEAIHSLNLDKSTKDIGYAMLEHSRDVRGKNR